MKKLFSLSVCLPLVISLSAQIFQGKIIYKNSYKSNVPGATDEQLTQMFGSATDYYIKDGDYKSVTNGYYFQSQLYINTDNKLYNKLAVSEKYYWEDGATNKDEVLNFQLNKNATEILGYKCDELILDCKSGKQTYYFSSSLGVNASLFEKHKYGNWYFYLTKANGLPLKMKLETPQFSLESVATEVKSMQLEKSFFTLPANTQTEKSPN